MSLRLLIAGLVACVVPQIAAGQTVNQWPIPRLSSVFPAGGQAGATVEVTVAGTDLDDAESLWFSHPGIRGTLISEEDPKVDKAKSDGKTPAKVEVKKVEAKKGPTPTRFRVTIDKSAPTGMHDVRVVGGKGISNPRTFVVGAYPEVSEMEPNNDVDQATNVSKNQTVNGTIGAGTDVDYFALAVKKGDRFLIHIAGPSIDSRLSAEATVFDAQGRRLAYARALPGEDAILDVAAEADGELLLRLNQFTYTAGGGEFFYRMTIWPGPWVDAVFPPVAEAGKSAPFTIHGRGLPGGKTDPSATPNRPLETAAITIDAPAETKTPAVLGNLAPLQGILPGFEFRVAGGEPKFLAFAQAPIVVENPANDSADQAQRVPTPCEIVGRIEKSRDVDWYVFPAKKGDVLMIDAASHRLGSPTDLFVKLVDLGKKSDLAFQDDTVETLSVRGYFTANRDPQPIRFVAPEDGEYHLLVGSHTSGNAAGPEHVYRVRIAPERPDFQIVVMPAEDVRGDSCVLPRGGAANLVVIVQRVDGWKGDVELKVEGLPRGVSCPPQRIGAGVKQTSLVLLADDAAPERFDGPITVVGTGEIDGKPVVRVARPASVTWGSGNPQATTPSITRHDRSLMFAIRGQAPVMVAPKVPRSAVLAGDKIEIPFVTKRLDPEFKGNFQTPNSAVELPSGVTLTPMTFAPGKDEQKLTVTTQPNSAPGEYNLVLRGFGPIAQGKGKALNAYFPTAPTTLVIVPKQLAVISPEKTDIPVSIGGEAEVRFKIVRPTPFAPELMFSLLPDNAAGLSAEPLKIAPDQAEVRIALKADAKANPGNRGNVTLRAVGVVEGLTVNHDVTINVNVMKGK